MKFTVVKDGPEDRQGKLPFTIFWLEPEGVFRPELGVDGKPVGYRRAQCYRTHFKTWLDETKQRGIEVKLENFS